MATKATNAEVELRVYEVFGLILQSTMRHEIVQYCAKNYDIDTRQADNYIRRAREILYETIDEDADKAKSKRLNELDHLYATAYSAKEFNVCLGVRRLQATLDGLLITKLEHDLKKPETFAELVALAERNMANGDKGKGQ